MDNTTRMQQTDDAWNTRDWDAFDRLHDPKCVVYWPGREAEPTQGGDDHRAEAIAFCEAFPDNEVKNRPYDVLFGEGDFTCFVTRFTGTFTAPLKQPDGSVIEPTESPSTCCTPPPRSGATAGSSRSTSSTTMGPSSRRSALPD